MQILEIYIHTIIYIHIHTYTTSSTTTTTTHHHHPHHPHHRGEGGTDTFIYIHIQLLPPPPPPPPTTTHTNHTTGGRGVHHHPPPPTTTHHHPHHRGEGGTGALLYRPITMGWGGGRYLAMLAHIYIYIYFVIHNIVLCLVNLVPTVSKKTWCQKQKFLSCEILLTFPTHRTSKSKWGFPVSRHQNQTALGHCSDVSTFRQNQRHSKKASLGVQLTLYGCFKQVSWYSPIWIWLCISECPRRLGLSFMVIAGYFCNCLVE